MVNTFLPYPSFSKSAASLDTKRLGKQRVEAFQILNILNDLVIIAKFYGWPLYRKVSNEEDNYSPEQRADLFLKRCEWVKEIRTRYLSMSNRLMERDGYLIEVPKSFVTNEGERILKLGFSSHPTVRMWCGYERALKLYINAMIDEWSKRTTKLGAVCKNTMKRYVVKGVIPMPWWVTFPDLNLSHQASLLRKGHIENSTWYLDRFFKIPIEYILRGYCWPPNLNRETIVNALKGKGYLIEEVTLTL